MLNLSLDDIGILHSTDKASWVNVDAHGRSRPGHGYLRLYDQFLSTFRNQPDARLLELGLGVGQNRGASLRMWKDYFNSSVEVFGVDIDPDCECLSDEGFSIKIGNLGNKDFLQTTSSWGSFDVILDDASHLWEDQVECFEHFFPQLIPGGYYIIEDLHTSFGDWRKRFGKGRQYGNGLRRKLLDSAEYVMQLGLSLLGGGETTPHAKQSVLSSSKIEEVRPNVEFLVLAKSVAIFKKKVALPKGE